MRLVVAVSAAACLSAASSAFSPDSVLLDSSFKGSSGLLVESPAAFGDDGTPFAALQQGLSFSQQAEEALEDDTQMGGRPRAPGKDAAPAESSGHVEHKTQASSSKPPAAFPVVSRHVSATEELASVVKIFVDAVKADFESPWQVASPTELTGSGFAVQGQMIMTNAHVVADQTRVLVRKHGNPKRFVASVLSVCHECDLALISVQDEEFWKGVKPLPFGGVPQLQETVAVLGYPTGGDQLSVTEGVVSRVGVSKYAHSSIGLLTVQIDAAINPGNSGGPAVSRGKVVGVAFQGFSQMQNVGYIVPFPVIRHFLNDIALHKRHTGFVSIGIKAQSMENEALKKFKGLDLIPPEALPKNVTATGVLVMAVDRVRTSVYASGKILLPPSRYRPLSTAALEGGGCSKGVPLNFGAASKAAETDPCRRHEKSLELLEDKPVGSEGDVSASQREVEEVSERVVWQPPGWRPSSEPTLAGVALHRQLLPPEEEAPQKEMAEELESAASRGSGETHKGQETPETEHGSSKPASERTPEDKEETVAAQPSGSSPTEGQAVLEEAVQSAEKREAAGAASAEKPENGSGGSMSSNQQDATPTEEIKPTPEALSSTQRRMREFVQKVISPERRPQLGGLLDLFQAAATDNLSTSGETASKKGVSPRQEEEQPPKALPPSEAEGRKNTEADGGKAQPAATSLAQLRLSGKSVAEAEASRKEGNFVGGAEVEIVRLEDRQIVGTLKTRLTELELVTRRSSSTNDCPLAAARHPAVDNPYFNPRLLEEEEFFGLREGDVLLSIGNYNIADDGTVALRDLERVSFSSVLTEFFNGQTTFAYVLRDRRIIKVTVPLTMANFKVPPFTWDTRPSYFVYGGFVFTPLTKAMLTMKLRRSAPHMFEYLIQKYEFQEQQGDEFVVLSLVLASEVSVGYELPPCLVRSVNGRPVSNLKELVQQVEETGDGFVRLGLQVSGSDNMQVVLDKTQAMKVQRKVLEEHNIHSDRSPDLL